MPEKLPTLSAATLLRTLFKRPARSAGAGPIATRYLLEQIGADEVARYRRALGFAGTRIPLTYYYLLAQRAHLATMLGAAFPFRLVGAIHVDNALRAGMQPVAGRPLELATEVRVGTPAANGAVHAVLDTRATQDGELVFACSSTYLVVRGKRSGDGPRASARAAPALAPVAGWRLSATSGRRYAALSGDWNPIHLWPWSARPMGLKAPIIHGMHTLGRACAELERAGGRPVAALGGRFRAPIELGGEAALAASLAEGRFTVASGGRVAVEGEFAFDASQPMQEAYARS
ncbi:MaoC/PaaZ C-terminal domain-containing protein [Massilia aerilata]|uniref:MaoC/PaaZ C-terminal domain-containing protein n=1 Tax=Massilia aerilata TaxID=453817 RepID=A0ABW0RQ02_9BURK